MRSALIYPYYYSGGSEALPQATAPSPLIANSLDTTTANVSWNDTGADNYILQRATQSDYSDATEIYSGALLTFADSGLTMGAMYYYRVKAQVTGESDSEWVTDSVQTISFMPDAWYEMTGIGRSLDNAYGTTLLAAQVETIKSIINTSGPTATYSGTPLQWIGVDYQTSYPMVNSNNSFVNLGSDISFAGDFTIVFRIKITATPVNNYIFCDKNSTTKWFRIQNLTNFQFNVGNGVNGSTFTTALVVGRTYLMSIQRSGTDIKVSMDGGNNYRTVAGGAVNSFAVNRFFASDSGGSVSTFYYQRIVLKAAVLTLTQITEIDNYLKRSAYTPVAVDAIPVIKGVTWDDLTNVNYYINNTMSSAATAASNRDRVITRGDKTFILVHKVADTTYYLEDFLVVYDHTTGKISSPLMLGVPFNSTDVHNNGSIFLYNNRVYHLEYDQHYDAIDTKLVIKTSRPDFDLTDYQELIQGKGVPAVYEPTGQYNTVNVLSDNKIYVLAQVPTSAITPGNDGVNTVLYISDDNCNYFEKRTVCDSGSLPEFTYPTLLESADDVLRIVINNPSTAFSSRHRYSYYIESHDYGVTWQNLEGTFSKDISNNNRITIAELRANCIVLDASALTGQAKITHAFVDNTGEVYGVVGNGNSTGFKMFYGSSGGSFTLKDIGVDGKTVPYDLQNSDGDNLPFLIKRSDQVYDFYCHETNGGNWRIIRIRTTDKGDTWTYQETLTNDDTKKHQRMMPTKNAHTASYLTLAAMRSQTTYGDLFIKDITTVA